MSEKYRYFKIDVWNPDTDFQVRQYLSEKEDDFFIVGSFVCESDADEYCKRKNENEARKNQPRIDKDVKNNIIGDLTNYEKIFVSNEIKLAFQNAIEIISNLPTGEN